MLCAEPAIGLAVLFGSQALGSAHAESDTDIAILPTVDLSLDEELGLAAKLEREARGPVDLVRLDRADPLVRYEVARHGRVLHEATAGLFARFSAEAALEYLDLEPVLTEGRRRYLARLASAEP